MTEAERQELRLLRQLEAKLRESLAATLEREAKFPAYLKTKSVKFWADALARMDEYRRNGFKPTGAKKVSNGQADGPHDRQHLLRRSKMAKLQITPEIEAHTNKAVAAALKAERKRVADGVKNLVLPEGTTARAAAAIKKAVKEAVASQD